ncbi:MAG: hypothetical protein EOO73_29185 [Myxococcales bacterium]|nr:MAG: hypothetical protein EOO73_29185 [Myxococcales bacterium]
MKRAALLLTASLLVGCVREAVLENDVRSAQWRARTLGTAADPALAFAALSTQLVELEALYQRDPSDPRARALLERGYLLMARGFIELRRLEAAAAGDGARAEQEAQLAADAERRASYYASKGSPTLQLEFQSTLRAADEACRNHDRGAYERVLNEALARRETSAEGRLEHALGRRLAALWLAPNVAARCAPAVPR